jgi:hypothetical protein
MLRKIPYSLYPLNDLTILSQSLSTIAVESHPSENMIMAAKEKIDEAVTSARRALASGNSSMLSGKIAEADDLRDTCYRSLRDHIQAGMGRDTHPDYQRACDLLWLAFTNNNTLLASLPYREETAALKGLFNDLEKFTEELELVNATHWLEELKEANAAFESLLDAETGHGNEKEVPTDQEAKVKLTDALKIYVNVINSLWSFGQPENIKLTVVRLNEVIKKANDKVKVDMIKSS